MAWIRVDASHEREIEKKYRLWGNAQPREPGQIGGKSWPVITGGPNSIDYTIDMQLPDEFVDALEGSEISFKRR